VPESQAEMEGLGEGEKDLETSQNDHLGENIHNLTA